MVLRTVKATYQDRLGVTWEIMADFESGGEQNNKVEMEIFHYATTTLFSLVEKITQEVLSRSDPGIASPLLRVAEQLASTAPPASEQ
jgi:hypothetical protein